MKYAILILAPLALLLGGTGQASASTVIDFEGYHDGDVITTQYHAQGVDFLNAIVLNANDGYNSGGYPPHSGVDVVYSGSSPSITATATAGSTWSDVSLWYTSAITGLFIDAYNSSGMLVATTFGGTNYGTNSQLSVSAPNIAYVVIHDSGNFFTVDDFTFTPNSAAPAPSSLVLLGMAGVTFAGYFGWRRRRQAVPA